MLSILIQRLTLNSNAHPCRVHESPESTPLHYQLQLSGKLSQGDALNWPFHYYWKVKTWEHRQELFFDCWNSYLSTFDQGGSHHALLLYPTICFKPCPSVTMLLLSYENLYPKQLTLDSRYPVSKNQPTTIQKTYHECPYNETFLLSLIFVQSECKN